MVLFPCSDRHIILSAIARAVDLPVEEIDSSKSFTELGGHSLSALQVQNECKGAVRHAPTVLSLLTSPCLDDLVPIPTALDVDQEPTAVNTPATSDSGFVEPPQLEGIPELPVLRLPSADSVHDGPLREKHEHNMKPSSLSLSEAALLDLSPPDSTLPAVDQAPVTEMQAALIRGGQSTITYSETWPLEDVTVLKYAWKTVVSMEPIFRTAFEGDGAGSYVMRLQDAAVIPWEEVVTFDRTSYEAEIAQRDSLVWPSFRFRTVVYKSSGRDRSEGTIIFAVHHALLDGWSMGLLMEKVRRVAVGESGVVPGKPFVQAANELSRIKKKLEHVAMEFWDEKASRFASAATGPALPKPRKRGAEDGSNEISIGFGELADRLRDTSRSLGVTVATMFYSAWALTQALYADSDAVVMGAILSGRDLPVEDINTVIGPTLNSLPLHVSINQDESTGELVRRVFRSLAGMTCFQWSTQEHGFSRSFEAALSVTRGLEGPNSPVRPLRAPHYDFESGIPLSLAIDEIAMTVRLVYHPDRYTRENAEGLVSCFRNALEGLTHSTSVRYCLNSLVSVPMQGRLRALSNCSSGLTTRSSHPEDLVSLFNAAVRDHSELPAVEVGDETVSYSELYRRASSVSKELSRLKVGGQVVCVHADGSLNWVVGLIGALQAGATICSLDATLPPELRCSMFETAGSMVFVVGSEAQTSFQPKDCSHCLVVDTITRNNPAPPEDVIIPTPNPAAPAYLCFTSGSTGKPKGVLCTHQGLVAFQKDRIVRLNAAPGVRISQFMSPAFDGSIHEIFSALCYGATLVLRGNADPFDVLRRVDSAIMTPSAARTLAPKDFPNLKTVSYRLTPSQYC